MAELVDALVLGTSEQSWEFESPYSYHYMWEIIMTMRDDKKLDKMIRDTEKSWNNMIVFHRDKGSDWFPFHGELRKGDGTFIKRIVINP